MQMLRVTTSCRSSFRERRFRFALEAGLASRFGGLVCPVAVTLRVPNVGVGSDPDLSDWASAGIDPVASRSANATDFFMLVRSKAVGVFS
jgi:hypothetical protein